MPTPDGHALCLLYLGSTGVGLKQLLPIADGFSRDYHLISYGCRFPIGATNYPSLRFADAQTRLETNGIFLDGACREYVGDDLPRFPGESDDDYRSRVLADLFPRSGNGQVASIVDHVPIPPDLVAACDVLICHDPAATEFIGGDRFRYEQFLRQFPDSCRRITVPDPRFPALWPFCADDPRNADLDRPRNRQGQLPTYPFGDSLVLEQLQLGAALEDIIARYLALDVATIVDLDALMADCIRRIEQAERGADVKICEFVASTFRRQKVFSTPSQAQNPLLLQMTNQVLTQIGCPTIGESILDRLQPLVPLELPIHPSIGRHFGLQYVDDTARYFINHRSHLTFDEFIRNYVTFA
jgi:hypothetical protein